MDFNKKGYIFIDDKIIPLEINEEILKNYFIKNNLEVNKDNIKQYGNFEYHYQYLEFFCDYFGLSYDKSKKDNLVLYANYLDYILTSNGYIVLTIVQLEDEIYNFNELPLFSKEKVRIRPQTIMVVPDDKEIISEGQKYNLKNLRNILQYQTDLDIYSYKNEEDVFNGIYTRYSVDKYFNKVIENKKTRFGFR